MTNQMASTIEAEHEAGESIRVLLCRPDDIYTIPDELRPHVSPSRADDARRHCDGCTHIIWVSQLALGIYHQLVKHWRRGFIIRPRMFCPSCFQEIRERLPDTSFTAIPLHSARGDTW